MNLQNQITANLADAMEQVGTTLDALKSNPLGRRGTIHALLALVNANGTNSFIYQFSEVERALANYLNEES